MNARSVFAASAVAAMTLAGAASNANAITWTLVNVPLDDGGTLSGTFSITSYGYQAGYDLTTTTGSKLPGAVYDSALGSYAANVSPPDKSIIFFPEVGGAGQYAGALQLTFLDSLINPGVDPIVGGTGGPSWECAVSYSCVFGPTDIYNNGPIRYVEEGRASFASATPLPATWTFMLIGLVGISFAGYRRKSVDPGFATT